MKLKNLIQEISYPKAKRNSDDKFKYNFTVYQKGGEKIHTDYYDIVGAKKMKQILDKSKETYSISVWKDGYGDEIHSL